ncbi:MAG: DUF1365 domain-containing protein [Rubrivivax sp.]|nr:DUF1365 domain-containing protein [Rubrivivax sp.]
MAPLSAPPEPPAPAGGPGARGAQALLAHGEVRHARLRPATHAFHYPTLFVMLPMRSLRDQPCEALSRNRRSLFGFRDADHGEGGPDALAWLEGLLQREGVQGADGEIWLQTYPRMFGYAFKPVSFWYCHAADGRLRAVVAEVNNTFGERHCYLLDGADVAWGATLQTDKRLHVSPFCSVAGGYRFRFGRAGDRLVARVEHVDEQGPLIVTSVSGRLEPLTPAAVRSALRSMPLLTYGVMARIHWQALALWRKRVPFFRKPAAPTALVTR